MTIKQASSKPAVKPLVTDTLNGQCENHRRVDGVANRRCPRQGSLREITGGIASGRVKLCDWCTSSFAEAGYAVRTVTAIEGAAIKGEHP